MLGLWGELQQCMPLSLYLKERHGPGVPGGGSRIETLANLWGALHQSCESLQACAKKWREHASGHEVKLRCLVLFPSL